MRYAEIRDGKVVDIRDLPTGIDIADTVPPDFLDAFVQCKPAVEIGWNYTDGKFTAPEEVVTSLDEVRTAKLAEVNSKRDAVVAGGYHHNFGGSIGSRILDQRDAKDETAWLTVKGLANDAIAADQPDTPFRLRDAKNQNFTITAAVASAAMSAMGMWRSAVSGHSWDLKELIELAETVEELDGIDINDGWPK